MEQKIENKDSLPLNCVCLVKDFEARKTFFESAQKFRFEGVDGYDVYNISPFRVDNEILLVGRMEKRERGTGSHLGFFKKERESWVRINDVPNLQLEDGFVTTINNEIVLGGVETYSQYNLDIGYRTVFYRGRDLKSLSQFTTGPDMMKDIRFIELPSGYIGVCTRPQGENNGKGKIGYIELKTLDDLNAATNITMQCHLRSILKHNRHHPLQ